MSPSLKMRHGLFLAVVALVLMFQNCSQPTETSSMTSNSATAYQSALPLAVTAQIDTISHMSCSEIKDPVEKRAYFSYRAGAYSNLTGGLSLTPAFRDATKHYNVTERARAFANSDANGDTRYNLSIRSTSNYQSPWISEELRVGEEIEAMLPPLDADAIAGPLAASQPGAMINYFPGAQAQRLTEGSLRFYKFENVMKDTRTNLDSRQSLLVAGFSGGSDELNTVLRAPPGAAASPGNAVPVYGRGYFLRFSLPVGYSGGERRVLASSGGVEEIDLSTSPPVTTVSNWDCNTNYQFVVVRPEDKAANRVICNATIDRFADGNQQAALAAIRRVLRVEDWFVDLANHCVIPKRTGDYCYGALNGRTIQYGTATCLNSTTTLCPHFVSICIRR